MAATTHLPDVRHAREWLKGITIRLYEWADDECQHTGRGDEMREAAMTLNDVYERAPLPRMDTNTITLDASAGEAFSEAQALIIAADAWAAGANIDVESVGWDEAQAIVNKRREQVCVMRDTLARSLMHLMFCSQSHDGPIRFSRDSHACWFWQHPRSGYHGGLIFHPSYADGERLPVGTWSVHT